VKPAAGIPQPLRPRALTPLRGESATGAEAAPRAQEAIASPWLTYAEAAAYTGWTVAYLRNLVSAGQIPVYGKPRVRRFRRDVLDEFLTDPDAAMRRFRAERNQHGG
jgi:excisionase family DNA binding protein